MRSFQRLLSVLATLLVAFTARAQTPVFSDNFNSSSPGALPSTPYNWGNNGATIVTDSGNLLQEGAGNQMVQLTPGEYLGVQGISGAPYTVASLSFTLYLPAPSSSSQLYVEFGDSGYGDIAGENITAGAIIGSSGTDVTGTPTQFTFVINTGLTTANYLSAAQSSDTIGPQSIQVWQNGTLIVPGWTLLNPTPPATTPLDPVSGIIFSDDASHTGNFDIDNLAFYSGAVVGALPAATPEPSVTDYLALSLAVGGVGMFFRRRFFRGTAEA
jgi:hypothetical protein